MLRRSSRRSRPLTVAFAAMGPVNYEELKTKVKDGPRPKKERSKRRRRDEGPDDVLEEGDEESEPSSAEPARGEGRLPTWKQPWSPALAQEDGDEAFDEGGVDEENEVEDWEEDEEVYAFFDEQRKPTPGLKGQPRVRKALPLPDPLPLLIPPDRTQLKPGEQEEPDFMKAYGKARSTIMDIDGKQLPIPEFENFQQAAEQLGFPPFLRAALARKRFFRMTPVQKCTVPLLLDSKDFLASSFTGSGKTAAYLLPILTALYQASRLAPGMLVAAHYKLANGTRSAKPMLGKIKGLRNGLAAIEFDEATGKTHRQLIPPSWVVGSPEPPPAKDWVGPAQPMAVILVPTRELAEQVQKEASELTLYSSLRSVCIYGSSNVKSQLRNLAHGADLLVATPGRLVDVMHRGVLKLDRVKYFVIDEVDRMMELGFGSQLEEIVEQGSMMTRFEGRHTSFWSATIPNSVRQVTEAFLGAQMVWVDCTGGKTNPVPNTIEHVLVDARPPHRVTRRFEVGCQIITNKGRRGTIEFPVGNRWRCLFTDGDLLQHKVMRRHEIFLANLDIEAVQLDRFYQLSKVLRSHDFKKATVIVFCRRRETTTEVYRFLKEQFDGVVVVHGGMSQKMRSKNVQALREGKAEVLVATDIAARGLDIPTVTHVINYELPQEIDEFVHRCGRTGRIGRSGMVVSFVTGREKIFGIVRRVIKATGQYIPDWFSHEGMKLGWRPRYYRPPFNKMKDTPLLEDSFEEKQEFSEKMRDHYFRKSINRQQKALERANGPVDKADLNSLDILEGDREDLLSQRENPLLA